MVDIEISNVYNIMGQIQSQNQYPIWKFVWKNANLVL
jgi:hypothetical protein